MIARCLPFAILALTVVADPACSQSRTQRGQDYSARNPNAGVARTAQGQRQPAQRPSARPVKQQQVLPPALEKLLVDWEVSSKRIKKLQGTHLRRVYDTVFKVEKKSTGKFYYESPDKGRIDINPAVVEPGTRSARKDAQGQPFKVTADQQEKWICDGTRIIDIDEEAKAAAIYPLPPQGQGVNIMNGPLPFLFGMPAHIAKQRYWLELVGDRINPTTKRREVRIKAKPRWQQDIANWQEAQVILDCSNFLPLHVKLVDPAGTTETVFSFSKLEVNKLSVASVFGRTPFRPNLRGYKIVTKVAGTPDMPVVTVPEGHAIVPDVRQYHYSEAKQRLVHAGFKVADKFGRGGPAPRKELEHTVRELDPPQMTPLQKGSTIKLVVYERSGTRATRQKN